MFNVGYKNVDTENDKIVFIVVADMALFIFLKEVFKVLISNPSLIVFIQTKIPDLGMERASFCQYLSRR